MNAYQTNYLSQATNIEQPFYLSFLYYVVCPLILGTAIDVGFSTVSGSQICSFDGETKKCVIFGQSIAAWVRELGRVLIQLILLFTVIFFLKSQFKASLYPILGLILFIVSQQEMIDDFRRFVTSLLFMMKHGKL